MKNNNISIIIPVYNAASYITECIDSLIAQTYDKCEIILIDDGSTDNSLSIMKNYKKSHNNIKVISKVNGGVSSARNAGIENTTGEYILFVDADDWLYNETSISELVSKIDDNSVDWLLFGSWVENKKNITYRDAVISGSDGINVKLGEFIVSEKINAPWGKLYKTKIIKKYKIRFNQNLTIGEDLEFNIRYAQKCAKIQTVDNIYYFYRTSNSQSATKKITKNKYQQLTFTTQLIQKWANKTSNLNLTEASRYVQIKNILSCTRDNARINKNHSLKIIREGKRCIGKKIITRYGPKPFILSIFFIHLPTNMIYKIVNMHTDLKHEQ